MPLDIAATRRRAARWREHDAKVPYRDERPRGRAHVGIAPADTTGGKVAGFSAYRGRRVPWRQFPTLAPTRAESSAAIMVEFAPAQFCAEGVLPAMRGGRRYERVEQEGNDVPWTIPQGARLRAAKPRAAPQPRQDDLFWLGRKCLFPGRYSDPNRQNRGNPRRQAVQALWAILRPLSAKATARTAIAHLSAPVPPVRPAPMRSPMAEERTQGRLSARHISAAYWFQRNLHHEAAGGHPLAPASGGIVVDSTRDPLALFPLEAAADTAIRVRHRFRSLGGLARVVVKALEGAEMRDLAPAWPIPQRNVAEAGRIRLRAALELCARMAERETDKLPLWETLEVARAACTECATLEAKRKLRAANDNVPMRIAA